MSEPNLDLAIPLGTSAFREVHKLASFLESHYPDDVLCALDVRESAVDVAIELIKYFQAIADKASHT